MRSSRRLAPGTSGCIVRYAQIFDQEFELAPLQQLVSIVDEIHGVS